MTKKRKKKVAKKTKSEKISFGTCPACGTNSLKDGICTNCNYGRKPKISD